MVCFGFFKATEEGGKKEKEKFLRLKSRALNVRPRVRFCTMSMLEIIDILRYKTYCDVLDVIMWSVQNIQAAATFSNAIIVTLRLF